MDKDGAIETGVDLARPERHRIAFDKNDIEGTLHRFDLVNDLFVEIELVGVAHKEHVKDFNIFALEALGNFFLRGLVPYICGHLVEFMGELFASAESAGPFIGIVMDKRAVDRQNDAFLINGSFESSWHNIPSLFEG